MVRLAGPFSRFGLGKALVIGDINIDSYTIGKVRRISPEAPVPVLHVTHEEGRPGCAGNVALSLIAYGMEVKIVGRVGGDGAGDTLKEMLADRKVDCRGVITEEGYQTPIKNRVIAENQQQIVRVDHEKISPLSEPYEQAVIDNLPKLLNDVDVVAISDYGKGFLTNVLLSAVIEMSRKRGIPVVVDPKGKDFSKYNGVTVLKPNFVEAVTAAHLTQEASLEEAAAVLFREASPEVLLITRSEEGITVFDGEDTRRDFPVRAKEVQDVTGAGDTVLATIACALANGLPVFEAAQLSNFAAGVAIEYMGCVHVTLEQLAERLLEYDVVNKVFEEEHLFALQHLLHGKQCLVLGVHSGYGLTPGIFRAIRQLSRRELSRLIIYIRDQEPDEDFVNMLASLKEVGFIILKNDSLRRFCDSISPDEVFVIEEDKLHVLDHTEALLR